MRFYPLHLKWVKIPIQQVKLAEEVTYNPIMDYGGWGIRWGFKGKAYNMSGDRGVKLHFFQHRPLLIGSQQPHQLWEAIEKAVKQRDMRLE
ncbi:MAG: hypothetical protein LPK19_14085 [Hymenobacteraceae bacterium]|nr:hypothetical protein [Hymenobacteraceae bacterium]MDX5397353.1 hypothetical protein [Hymenobacteraceae bacterium]MDX5513432.1 hypothetical protein [Hymenobacteraceae bacterium]